MSPFQEGLKLDKIPYPGTRGIWLMGFSAFLTPSSWTAQGQISFPTSSISAENEVGVDSPVTGITSKLLELDFGDHFLFTVLFSHLPSYPLDSYSGSSLSGQIY